MWCENVRVHSLLFVLSSRGMDVIDLTGAETATSAAVTLNNISSSSASSSTSNTSATNATASSSFFIPTSTQLLTINPALSNAQPAHIAHSGGSGGTLNSTTVTAAGVASNTDYYHFIGKILGKALYEVSGVLMAWWCVMVWSVLF